MKKNDKERLFEVMGRLDKTFKPPLNEQSDLRQLNNDMEIIIGQLVSSKGEENFNAILDDIVNDYNTSSDPRAIPHLKQFILSKFRKHPDVRNAFSNMLSYGEAGDLNEGIGDMEADGMPDTGQAPDLQDMPAPEAMPDEEGVEEKSPEEKLADLTAKVDEMYAMLHGEEEAPAEEPEEIEVTTGEVDAENLQEWNFDKKKGEEHEEKAEDKKEDEKEGAEDYVPNPFGGIESITLTYKSVQVFTTEDVALRRQSRIHDNTFTI